jgi:hypothetical protein
MWSIATGDEELGAEDDTEIGDDRDVPRPQNAECTDKIMVREYGCRPFARALGECLNANKVDSEVGKSHPVFYR